MKSYLCRNTFTKMCPLTRIVSAGTKYVVFGAKVLGEINFLTKTSNSFCLNPRGLKTFPSITLDNKDKGAIILKIPYRKCVN